MKLITGNDLASGEVIWWDGKGWSRHIAHAVDAGEAAVEIQRGEEVARRVNASYIIDAAPSAAGPVPAHIKDRIRAAGPTVRADLSINPAFPILKA